MQSVLKFDIEKYYEQLAKFFVEEVKIAEFGKDVEWYKKIISEIKKPIKK